MYQQYASKLQGFVDKAWAPRIQLAMNEVLDVFLVLGSSLEHMQYQQSVSKSCFKYSIIPVLKTRELQGMNRHATYSIQWLHIYAFYCLLGSCGKPMCLQHIH